MKLPFGGETNGGEQRSRANRIEEMIESCQIELGIFNPPNQIDVKLQKRKTLELRNTTPWEVDEGGLYAEVEDESCSNGRTSQIGLCLNRAQ
jgi:hypothetical protein